MKTRYFAAAVAVLLMALSATPASSLGVGANAAAKACDDIMTGGPVQRLAGFVAASDSSSQSGKVPDAVSSRGLPIYFERPQDDGDWIEITVERFDFTVQVPMDVPVEQAGTGATASSEAPAVPGQDSAPTQPRARVCQTLGGSCAIEVVAKAAVTTTGFWAFIFFHAKTTAHASYHTNIACGGEYVTAVEHYAGLGPRIASTRADANDAEAHDSDSCFYIYPTECPTHHEGSWEGAATIAGELTWFSLCGKTHIVNRAGIPGAAAALQTAIPIMDPGFTPVQLCFGMPLGEADDTGVQATILASAAKLGQRVFDAT